MNKLKIGFPALLILMVLVADSCINDDLNTPPGAVTLSAPLNAAKLVDLSDSLIWQEAIDLDGDLVTYDVYLGTEADPDTVVSTRQEGRSYKPELIPGATYYWKVIAQDGAEGTSESLVWSFTTLNPNNPPGAFNLLSPSNGATDNLYIDFLLEWETSTDPDGDTVTYDVLLSTDTNPTTIISSNQTGTTYGPALLASTTYYWKVIAKDSKEATSESAVWSFTTRSANDPPAAFNLTSPVNGSTDNLYIDFLLEWDPSTDPDGDAVTYDVLLSTDTNPTTVISSDQTGTTFGPTLTNGTTYYWKVVAKDGKGGTRDTEVWSFTTRNYEPGEINLIAPDDAEPDVLLDAILTWDAPADQDGDALTYDVYLGTSANPSTIVSSGQSNTTFTPSLTENTTYYWKIVAHDGKGGMGYSPEWSFTTIPPNNPPGAVNLSYPANEATNVSHDDISLTWESAIDPDGDAVTYDVLLGTSSNPTTVVSTGQSGTSFNPTLDLETSYYWKVVAKDAKGGITESAVWSFTTRSPNQIPGNFSLISPANKASGVTNGTSLTWETSIDPDGNFVTYDVYFGTDSDARTIVSKGQAGTSFTPFLLRGFTYYWRVVAKDGAGGTRASGIWSFTTVPAF